MAYWSVVKTIKCKLLSTPEQMEPLHQTLAIYVSTCNRILTTAKETDTKHKFTCIHCSKVMDADVNAAINIAAIVASVNDPKVTLPLPPDNSSNKPPTLASGG